MHKELRKSSKQFETLNHVGENVEWSPRTALASGANFVRAIIERDRRLLRAHCEIAPLEINSPLKNCLYICNWPLHSIFPPSVAFSRCGSFPSRQSNQNYLTVIIARKISIRRLWYVFWQFCDEPVRSGRGLGCSLKWFCNLCDSELKSQQRSGTKLVSVDRRKFS